MTETYIGFIKKGTIVVEAENENEARKKMMKGVMSFSDDITIDIEKVVVR